MARNFGMGYWLFAQERTDRDEGAQPLRPCRHQRRVWGRQVRGRWLSLLFSLIVDTSSSLGVSYVLGCLLAYFICSFLCFSIESLISFRKYMEVLLFSVDLTTSQRLQFYPNILKWFIELTTWVHPKFSLISCLFRLTRIHVVGSMH
jgi:hypothetical protein